MSGPVIVRMSDIRGIRGCARGARAFCVKHDIDWNSFLERGIDAEILDATGDHMAKRLTAYARERQEAERGRRR